MRLLIIPFLFFSMLCSAQMDLVQQADSIYNSNPDSSYALARRAEIQARMRFDSLELGHALRAKARYELLKSNLDLCDSSLNEAYRIFLVKNDPAGQAVVLRLRSILYGRLGNRDAEIKAIKNSLDLYRQAGDKHGMASMLLNYALQMSHEHEFEKATWALDELSAMESELSPRNKYYLEQNRGVFAFQSGNYSLANEQYLKAMKMALEMDMRDSYATITQLYGKSLYYSGNVQEGIRLLLESRAYSLKEKLDHERNEALQALTEVLEKEGRFSEAFRYLKEMEGLRDTLFNLERVNRINELEKELLLKGKQKELSLVNANLEMEKLEKEKVKTQNLFLFLVVLLVLVILIVALVMFFRTRFLKEKISEQATRLKFQHAEISEAYRNITDSIHYAKRIQDAILPPRRIIASYLEQSFILYLPKDIVAGDFYWMESQRNAAGESLIYFSVCDCTGHGVPGALVSVLGFNAMNRALKEFGKREPDQILNKVNELVEETFSMSDDNVRDGMDVSLCCLNRNTNKLQWSGANLPLWIVRNGELLIWKGDSQPIGKYESKKPFELHEIQLQKDDRLYLFSDGFADQFGEVSGKKLKYSRFREMILSLDGNTMEEQRQMLVVMLENWKGNLEQVDDICVIGVKI